MLTLRPFVAQQRKAGENSVSNVIPGQFRVALRRIGDRQMFIYHVTTEQSDMSKARSKGLRVTP